MGSGDTASAPRSLQKEILDRTWTDLKTKEFDEELIERLAALAEEGRISHSTEVIGVIEGSVGQ